MRFSLTESPNRACCKLALAVVTAFYWLCGHIAEAGSTEYNRWTAVDSRPDVPSNRQHHTANLIVRPSDDHEFMFVFGGKSNTAWTEDGLRAMECPSRVRGSGDEVATCCIGRTVNETWLFSIEHHYWLQVFSPSVPPARECHSAAPLAGNDGVVVFGGHSLNELPSSGETFDEYPRYTVFNDVWVFTPTASAEKDDNNIGDWEQPTLMTTAQPSRRFGASLRRTESNKYLLFGGCTGMTDEKCSNATNDLWELTVAFSPSTDNPSSRWTASWKELHPITDDETPPAPRWSHVGAFAAVRRRSMLVFGGRSGDLHHRRHYADLYVFVYGNNSSHGYWRALPLLNTTNYSFDQFTQASGVFNDTIDCLLVFLVFGKTEAVNGQGLYRFCFFTPDANSSGWWSANLLPNTSMFKSCQPLTFNLIGQSFLFYQLKQMLVYGGKTDIFTGEETSNLWTLPLTANITARSLQPGIWEQVHSNRSYPLQMAFHRCVAIDDIMVVIGGRAVASRNSTAGKRMGKQSKAEMTFAWSLNTTERRWEPIDIDGETSDSLLRRLSQNASFLIDFSVCNHGNQIMLFGGFIGRSMITCAGGDVSNIVTVFNMSTNTVWRVERIDRDDRTAPWPSARRGHTAVMFRQHMYVFGGVTQNSEPDEINLKALNDLWEYSTLAQNWTDLTANLTNEAERAKWPSPRTGHTAVVLNGIMYVFGGSGGHVEVSTGEMFWSYDIQARTWTSLTATPPILPAPRFFHAAAATSNNSFILSGGCKSRLYEELSSIGCLYCKHRFLISESTWLYNAQHNKWEYLHHYVTTPTSFSASSLNADARAMQSLVSILQNGNNILWQYGGYSQCAGNSTEVSTMRLSPGCNRGFYSADITQDICRPCPVSTYSDLAGATKCQPCPQYTGTLTEGSISLLNCSAKCDDRLCHRRGRCHNVFSASSAYTAFQPTCTACNFGYETDDNCDKPVVYYKLFGGLLGVIAALVLAAASRMCYRQVQKQRKQEKQLRTSRREISELTAAWQIDHSEVLMKRRIDLNSPGGFGEVWLAEYRDMKVAVKTLASTQLLLNPNAKDEMQNEMVLMRTLRHPNIVLFLGGGDLPDSKGAFIVMEYMAQGTLTSLLAKKTIHIDREQQLRFALDAARGMRFLHGLSPPRIHRDLKSGNLLVSERWVVKVADFGTSRLLQSHEKTATTLHTMQTFTLEDSDEDESSEPFVEVTVDGVRAQMTTLTSPLLQKNWHLTTHVGTMFWKAPEIIKKNPYGTPADVYSFGIVLWEILCRQVPFADRNFRNVFEIERLVTDGGRPTVPEHCPANYKHLMESCWADDPEIRPTFDEIVSRLERQLEGARFPIQFDAEIS